MPALSNLTAVEIRRTQEYQLVRRIIYSISTNSTFQTLIKDLPAFRFYPNRPNPETKPNQPALYCYVIREIPNINSNGVIEFTDMEIALSITLKSGVKYRPLPMNNDGTALDPAPNNHAPIDEAYLLKKALQQVFLVTGFKNRWYFPYFVTMGIVNGLGNIRYDFDEFGDAPGDIGLYSMGMSFLVQTTATADQQLPETAISITVTDGGVPSSQAYVTITDINGNKIEDSSGINRWRTNASGVATASGLISQKSVTVNATKGSKSGTSSQNLEVSSTLTATVAITT